MYTNYYTYTVHAVPRTDYSNLVYAAVLLGKDVRGKLHGHVIGVELIPLRYFLVIPVEGVKVHRYHLVGSRVTSDQGHVTSDQGHVTILTYISHM